MRIVKKSGRPSRWIHKKRRKELLAIGFKQTNMTVNRKLLDQEISELAYRVLRNETLREMRWAR